MSMNRRSFPYPFVSVNAWKFNLFELLVLVSCAAGSLALAIRGLGLLGVFSLLTVIAFRTAIFDFTIVGHLATFLTMVFGTVSITMLVLWSIGL